jgi:hypothetical protein
MQNRAEIQYLIEVSSKLSAVSSKQVTNRLRFLGFVRMKVIYRASGDKSNYKGATGSDLFELNRP